MPGVFVGGVVASDTMFLHFRRCPFVGDPCHSHRAHISQNLASLHVLQSREVTRASPVLVCSRQAREYPPFLVPDHTNDLRVAWVAEEVHAAGSTLRVTLA